MASTMDSDEDIFVDVCKWGVGSWCAGAVSGQERVRFDWSAAARTTVGGENSRPAI